MTTPSNNADNSVVDEPSDSVDLAGTVTWSELLAETQMLLGGCDFIEQPAQEAKWIVEEATGTSGAEFYETLAALATVRGVRSLDDMVARRRAGEPIQYVLGHWAFRGLDLLVDGRVLIPRPETEVVAGLAMAELDRFGLDRPIAVDLGTGSGAIGLSIAQERPGTQVLLTDASEDAIAVARGNLYGLGVLGRNVLISHGSWFDAIPIEYRGKIAVIVSNPPYIGTSEVLDRSVIDWEPESALRAGPAGLDDLRIIVEQASSWLRPDGSLVLEMASSQTALISEMARAAGFDTEIANDVAGAQRAVIARRTSS